LGPRRGASRRHPRRIKVPSEELIRQDRDEQ
jgi:hypothetical protein